MIKSMCVFFSVVVILASCSSKQKVPADVLSKPRMQSVLWDVLRADEFVMNYVKNDSLHTKSDESARLYEEVFRLHKTSRDEFKRSIIFYAGHPDLLKVILDSLDNRKFSATTEILKRPFRQLQDTSRKKLKVPLAQ